MADDDDLEFTVLNKKDVLVYQIPPASSSSGHKADDWKKCIWRGRCRVVGKGKDLYIKLMDPSSGNLFAQCAVPGGDHEKYVERVMDSSRYFVLKITNADRHAFIGLGFEDRNDAFDFNVALVDFKSTWVDKGGEQEDMSSAFTPSQDLSLKEGQKIRVNIEGMEGRRRRDAGPDKGGGGFAGLLAPPPPPGGSRRTQTEATAAPTGSAANGGAQAQGGAFEDDDFGDFSAAPAAPAPAAGLPPSGPDFFNFAPAVPASAAVASSPMGFADPFGAPAPAPTPAFAAPSPAPAFSMGGPAPAASGPRQFGAALGGPPGSAGSPLGFAGFGDPFGAPAQVAPAASADPFASINAGLGLPSSMAAPPQQPSYSGFAAQAPPPKPAQSANNAFDDLDIFK